jgi:hypothetical protein
MRTTIGSRSVLVQESMQLFDYGLDGLVSLESYLVCFTLVYARDARRSNERTENFGWYWKVEC